MPRQDPKEFTPSERERLGSAIAYPLENYAQLFEGAAQYLPPRPRRGAKREVMLVGPGIYEPVSTRLGVGPVSVVSVNNNPSLLYDVESFSKALINELPRLSRSFDRAFYLRDILTGPPPSTESPDMIAALDIHPNVVTGGGLITMAKMLKPGGLLVLTKTAPFPNELQKMDEAIKQLEQDGEVRVERINMPIPQFKHVVRGFAVENLWVFKVVENSTPR